jgi:hypothetical protein
VAGIDFHKRFQLLLATAGLVNAPAKTLVDPSGFQKLDPTEDHDLPKP